MPANQLVWCAVFDGSASCRHDVVPFHCALGSPTLLPQLLAIACLVEPLSQLPCILMHAQVPIHVYPCTLHGRVCILAKLLSAAAELLWRRIRALIAVSREVLASRICFVLLRTAADFVSLPLPLVFNTERLAADDQPSSAGALLSWLECTVVLHELN